MSWSKTAVAKKARRRGLDYEQREIDMIYLVAKGKAERKLLATILRRSQGGIDMIWRWRDGDVKHFPADSYNRIHRQLEDARDQLGAECCGVLTVRDLHAA